MSERTKMEYTMRQLILTLLMMLGLTAYAQKFQSDKFPLPSGKELSITFIKHGTLMMEYDGHTLHIDPVGMYADYSKLPKADLILITHQHGDHLDKEAIATLSTPDTRLIVTPTVNKELGKGEIYENGQVKRPFPWLMIETVPAYNTTPERQNFHPKGRDNGYILNIEDQRIYIAGDTEDIPEMKFLKNIDIAFLPVNQPYTMTIEQALNAGRMIKPAILYPYHYNDTKVKELVAPLKEEGIEVRIRDLQ